MEEKSESRSRLFFLYVLRGGVEGSRELKQLRANSRRFTRTESSYVRHVGLSLLGVPEDYPMSRVVWPDAEERDNMRGSLYRFQSCIEFVNWTNCTHSEPA